jgi:Zn finger protein HypA/HybF involved in hydrogenase expression
MIAIIASKMEERVKRESLKITRVVLEIGENTALLPDSIRFCFELCSQGTLLEGAALEIIQTAGDELKIKEVEVLPCAEPADVDHPPEFQKSS